MFEQLLLPLDGSRLAECVLPHAVAVASSFSSRLVLLHVLDRDGRDDQLDLLDWQLRKAEAQSYLASVRDRLSRYGLHVDVVMLEGMAPECIVDYAHKEGVDLILLSTHGRSGLSQWNISSTAHKIIERARTSLMIVRANQPCESEKRDYRHIMVPLDGSQRAEAALPVAVRLARHHQAELLLVHAMVRPQMFHRLPLTPDDVDLVNRFMGRNRLAVLAYLNGLQSALPVESEIQLLVTEDPAAALHQLAEQRGVDLLLLSAHGLTCNHRRPHGSLVTSCITYGCAPLLVYQDLSPEQIGPARTEETTGTKESYRRALAQNATTPG